MKQLFKRSLALLLCVVMFASGCAKKEPSGQQLTMNNESSDTPEGSLTYGLDCVNCTFLDETMDVSRNVMEIAGGMAEPMTMQVNVSFGPDRMVYKIRQLDGTKIKEIASSDKADFTFMADELTPGIPVYLTVLDDSGKIMLTRPLGLRVHKSLMADRVPDTMGSEFGSGFQVALGDILSGMSLNVLPFLIPVTVKTYKDGAVRIGIGFNSTDADFWAKAASGEMPEKELGDSLKALYEKDYKKINDKGSAEGLGLIVLFGGWAEGNVNTNDPVKGHMELYIGSGVKVSGQYMIFTWDITLTAGGQAQFDFSYVFSEEDSKYHFNADHILLGVKWGLEAYGGVGCKLASVGVYGAASLLYQQEMYPDPEAEHLILAGECGLKAKLFGKVLASFTIVSGSHDFLEDKNKLTSPAGTLTSAEVRDRLLKNDYANTVGDPVNDSGTMKWNGSDVDVPTFSNDYIDVRDFSHLLASDIYSDNAVQIANTGSRAIPMMSLIFLGNDTSRASGNRSVLMSSYYDPSLEFISNPAPIYDDGTADFDPYLFANDAATYVIWKNATDPLTDGMTFSEIAEKTELFCSESITGSSWHTPEQITELSGTGRYAAGARISADPDGKPVVAYYTNDVSDPLGLTGTHEVFLAVKKDGKWVSEKVTETNGMINSIDVSPFGTGNAVCISYEQDGALRCELWRGGEKIWEKDNASNGQFLGSGYNSVALVWYRDGRLYTLAPGGAESALTPENITIPGSNYELFGKLGSSPLLITATQLKDTSGNAFAYYSDNGGTTWAEADLTHVAENATVSHISAAFTYEKEPILVYSLQHYRLRDGLEMIPEEPSSYLGSGQPAGSLTMGDDERFIDGQSDLYIKARHLNRHLIITDGVALNTAEALPGHPLKFDIKLKNTGLYTIDHAVIYCGDERAGELTTTLRPGEETTVTVEATIPENPGTDLVLRFEASSRDDLESESYFDVAVDPGYLDMTDTAHCFILGQESIKYKVRNHGYSRKTFRIVVRDDSTGTVLTDHREELLPGGVHSGSYEAHDNVFSRDGYENVTLYVLFDGEEPGDPGISVNRIYSIMPLEPIYGQDTGPLE